MEQISSSSAALAQRLVCEGSHRPSDSAGEASDIVRTSRASGRTLVRSPTRRGKRRSTVPIISVGTELDDAPDLRSDALGDHAASTCRSSSGTITAGELVRHLQVPNGEKIGTMYGFDFVKNCSQLQAAFQTSARCDGRPDSRISPRTTRATSSGSARATAHRRRHQEPLDDPASGSAEVHGATTRTGACRSRFVIRTNNIAFVPIGNGLPKYHWGMSQNIDFGTPQPLRAARCLNRTEAVEHRLPLVTRDFQMQKSIRPAVEVVEEAEAVVDFGVVMIVVAGETGVQVDSR